MHARPSGWKKADVFLFSLVWIAVCPHHVLALEIYVSPAPFGVDDSACGNISDPCATLVWADNRTINEPGDAVIKLLPGTYYGG